MSVDVILQQIAIIFGYVLVGWVACKIGVLDSALNKRISDIVIKVTLPLSIVAGAELETSGNDLANMGIAAVVLLLSYIGTAVCVAWIAQWKHFSPEQKAVYTGLSTFPNSAFIGIPLCVALMGERALLYGAAGMVAYNALFFTYQYLLFHPEEKVQLKLFVNPLNASLLILIGLIVCDVRLPRAIQTVTYNVGAMTTPLALMIVGTMLAEGDLRAVFQCKLAYVFSVLRNFIIPFALLLVLTVLPLDYELKLAVMIYASCPCANLTAVFAAQRNMGVALCANTILLSTVLFMGSLPLLLWAAQVMFA